MKTNFRNYVHESRFGQDYHKVFDFLTRINQLEVVTPNFLWGRWTWMISRPVDNESLKNRIGIWESHGEIVALATFELTFGEVFICVDRDYYYLMDEVIGYAKEKLSDKGALRIIINDQDREFKNAAERNGFKPTNDKQYVAKLDLAFDLNYSLPEGFHMVSMADNWDFYQYNRIMWRGFNHDGEPDQSQEDIEWRKTMLSSPHLTPELTVAVVDPDGNYVAHCGLWHRIGNAYAYVEPVATDPSYRKMGLAKSAIYEAVTRAKKFGAREAYVVSSQQFYYNIGFKPHSTETWWTL